MSEAGNPQEPSMEEILASIRKIISEDSDEETPEPARATQPAPQPPAEEPPLELTEEVAEPEEITEPEEPLELTEEAVPMPRDEEIEALDESEEMEVEAPMSASTEELISQQAKTAAITSFRQLARNVKAQRPGMTVEQLAEELMRPMLREWLDENLPGMVERLVRREIERLARNSEDES